MLMPTRPTTRRENETSYVTIHMTPLFSRDLHAAQKAKMIGIDGRDRQPCRIRTKTRTNNKGSASF